MKRLDNKGQSLVMFILLIPIMLGIMALVIDCGNVMVRKNEIGNVIEMVLDYGFAIDKGAGDTGAGNVDADTGVDSDINDRPVFAWYPLLNSITGRSYREPSFSSNEKYASCDDARSREADEVIGRSLLDSELKNSSRRSVLSPSPR